MGDEYYNKKRRLIRQILKLARQLTQKGLRARFVPGDYEWPNIT